MCHNMVCSQGRPAPDDSPLQMICLPVAQLGEKTPWHETCDALWTRSITHTNVSTQTTNLFLPYCCTFTFLHMTKAKEPEMFLMFMSLQWGKGHTHNLQC